MKHWRFPVNDIVVANPKLYMEPSSAQEARIFPYYAGYSAAFAAKIISSLRLKQDSLIFDPWNGSGTTTMAAFNLGYKAVGFDLNPAMVVVAKAGMLAPSARNTLIPLAERIIAQARTRLTCQYHVSEDPLLSWLTPRSALHLRAMELAVNRTFTGGHNYEKLATNDVLENVTPLSASLYVCLFKTARRLLADFIPSNPTWIKKPKTPLNRKRPAIDLIEKTFREEVKRLANMESPANLPLYNSPANITLRIGNAENLALSDGTVDAIVSSPPYCTRIDYAVATSIELAVLQFNAEAFNSLRRQLTGAATVSLVSKGVDERWGHACVQFMTKLYNHPSKASKGYYYKNHLQYFDSIFRSIQEISRVLRSGGFCALVAQDSHYKEIHNDVPSIMVEMAAHCGMLLLRRDDFISGRSMVTINKKSKNYIPSRQVTESVLCFGR